MDRQSREAAAHIEETRAKLRDTSPQANQIPHPEYIDRTAYPGADSRKRCACGTPLEGHGLTLHCPLCNPRRR